MRRHRLYWVVRQVASQFAGNVSELNDREILAVLTSGENPAVPLRALLDAIEMVIVETALMEREIQTYFSPREADEVDEGEMLYDIPVREDLVIPARLYTRDRRSTVDQLKRTLESIRGVLS
jgi:hypothetical protein